LNLVYVFLLSVVYSLGVFRISASLVICIQKTVGLWRMDCEQSLWQSVEQFVFCVMLLVKCHCHFVVSVV